MTPDDGTGIVIVPGSNPRIGQMVMRQFGRRFGMVVIFDHKAPGPPAGCVCVPVEITSVERPGGR